MAFKGKQGFKRWGLYSILQQKGGVGLFQPGVFSKWEYFYQLFLGCLLFSMDSVALYFFQDDENQEGPCSHF